MGDMIGLHSIIFGLDKDGALGKAVDFRINPYRVLSGLGYAFLALLLWKWIDKGWVGKSVGLFLGGIALSELLKGARNVP